MTVKPAKSWLTSQVAVVRKFLVADISKLTLKALISAVILLPAATVFLGLTVFGVALDGRQWVLLSVFPILTGIVSLSIWWIASDMLPDCGSCSLHDLNSALEKARAVSEKGARHLRDVLDSMTSFIGVLTPEGVVLEINRSALSVASLSMIDVVGRKFEDTRWWAFSEEVKNQVRGIIRRAAAGERVEVELKYQTGTGEIRAVEFVMTPLVDREGKVEFLIPSGVDVQFRKSFEEQLIKSRLDAEIANQAKSSFLAHMSHELRSPLGIILGFVDLALEEGDCNKKNLHLETIHRNACQVLSLVDEVLDLGKIESGHVSVDIVDVNVEKFISEIEVSLGLKARERGLKLQFVLSPGTPRQVRTDPLRVKQILLNLIGNAIKYSEVGTVECKVSWIPGREGERSKLEFEITDTGIGISAEDASRIFEPFARGLEAEQRKYPGTGLGLSLSKRLALLLGGDVVLTRSQLGVGSTFTFTIEEGSKGEGLNLPISVPPKRVIGGPGRLSGVRVLVVDDVIDNRILISKYLQSEGASVVTASGGQEAVTLGLEDGFDAILMDLSMPDMSGQEATAALRQRGYKKPIVALTAHAMREEKEKALQRGFNDYLTKPVVRDVLVEALKKVHETDRHFRVI